MAFLLLHNYTDFIEIKDGSLISLKGYGRAIFDEVISETKKGKMRARVKKVL
jgi:RNA-binding protein YlmH